MKIIVCLISCLLITTTALAQEQDTICVQPFQLKESFQEDTLQTGMEDDILKEMDALLDLWFIKKQMESLNMETLNDNIEEDCLIDSVIRSRLEKLQTVIPVTYNYEIRRKIELYVCKRKRSSSIILGLSQYYFPWMREIFDQYDVPEELIYITIVESALNPVAVSRAGATGIWQFMYRTGKVYQLEVNTFIDDRRDPFKATDAAARHLRDLYNIFNDWGLAISAYNCGAGGVRKAIARSGGKTDFWGVKPFLPRETQNYFPYYIAAFYLVNHHLDHGIPFAELTIPFVVDTVMVKKELHLNQVAEMLEIDIEELKILNPQYKRLIIPAQKAPYPLRLKNADILRFIALEDTIYRHKYEEHFATIKIKEELFAENSEVYVVKKGDTLGAIAARFRTTVRRLADYNNLRNTHSLSIGQRLRIPPR